MGRRPRQRLASAGLLNLSTATYSVPQKLQDYGSVYAAGTATHHLTLNGPAPRSFGAGTVQWAWGLDAVHDFPGTPMSPAMQQATVNLLADMGAQPKTIDAGLIPAIGSSDATPPASTILAPTGGATFPAARSSRSAAAPAIRAGRSAAWKCPSTAA